MKRTLFPVPLFLLPNGLTRLRIIEYKHVKMVTKSVGDVGFVIVYMEGNNLAYSYEWGVFVKIVDFHRCSDGFLMVDVKADSLVTIDAISDDLDGLQHADISYKPLWESLDSSLLLQREINYLSSLLFDFYDKDAFLGALYQDRERNDNLNKGRLVPSEKWLCHRWLELLPINIQVKRSLINDKGYQQSVDLLRTLILVK